MFDKDSAGIAKYSKIKAVFCKTPDYSEHEALLDFFIEIAREKNFKNTIVLATDDEQIKFLSKFRNELKEFYRIDYPEWNLLSKIFYKNELYKLAANERIPVPESLILNTMNDLNEKKINYPVIIKPSEKEKFLKKYKKKAIECRDENILKKVFSDCEDSGIKPSELMIQQIVKGGGETQYSLVGIFKNGEYLYKRTALRTRQHPINYGKASTYVEMVEDNEILENYSKRLLRIINYSGPFEAEYKYDRENDKYYLLDINLRFWGWHNILKEEINIPEILIENNYNIKNGFLRRKNVTWINLITDLPVALRMIMTCKLSLFSYIKQIFTSINAVYSFRDPLPFIMQVLLIPYLFIKRGY